MHAPAHSILAAESLGKTFGAHTVLSQVDLVLQEREVVCVIGPSGSGKTTLLRCLALLEQPAAGRVTMRVGASDARWFRMAGIPAVVYGPTPHGMGGPDEWVDVAELDQVARVHALTAFDLLQGYAP